MRYPVPRHTPPRSHARVVRLAALVGLLLAGCMRWQQPSTAPRSDDTLLVRLQMRDSSSLILEYAVVTPDTVTGHPWRSAKGTRVAIPRTDVRAVEIARKDHVRSLGAAVLVAVGTVALLALTYYVLYSGSDN